MKVFISLPMLLEDTCKAILQIFHFLYLHRSQIILSVVFFKKIQIDKLEKMPSDYSFYINLKALIILAYSYLYYLSVCSLYYFFVYSADRALPSLIQ
jgi:hypothetical protein